MTTISLPAFSGWRATLSAATTAAPEEIPTSRPSSKGKRRAISMASSLVTVMIASMDSVRRRLSPGEHRAVRGLNRNRFEGRLPRLDVFGNAGDGPAGADAGDQEVDLAVGVIPNLGTRSLEMYFRIGRVVELLQHVTVRSPGEDFFRFGDGGLHPLGTRRENNLRPKGAQQDAALHAHGIGHGQNEFVALDGSHESQGNAGVAAGRLDQHGLAGMNFAGALGVSDHADPDAVFYTGQGILAFQFTHHLGDAAFRNPVQPYQRGVADEFRDVLGDVHFRFRFLRGE